MAPSTQAHPEVKKGLRVIHHGRLHEITELPKRARMVDGKPAVVHGIVFENDGYKVTMMLDGHLRYSEADQAFFFHGRLLSRNERALCQAITGAWPPADNHEAMRSMLDSVDLGTVDMAKFAQVLLERKADTGVGLDYEPDPDAADGRGAVRQVPLNASDQATLDSYAVAALAQVAELRAIREG